MKSWGYFKQKEDSDPNYKGYADIAANIGDSIEMARQAAETDQKLVLGLPIMPERADAIWLYEQTPASKELVELVFSVNKLEPVIDETSEDQPYGRVLWQSSDRSAHIMVIVKSWHGHRGDAIKLSAVSEIPDDLFDARPAEPIYSPETARAIAISKKLKFISRRRIHEARDEELDYILEIQKLPVADFESPYDQAA